MKQLFGFLLISTAVLACSSSESATGGTGGSYTVTSASDGSGSSSSGSSSSGSSSSGSSSNALSCPAETLCLNVKPSEPGKAVGQGRIAVVWFQLSDDAPDPKPLVAYDAPFDPSAAQIQIPLASIQDPTEVLLLCERACDDETQCACTADPKVGIGYVVVAEDENKNGKLDIAEVEATTYGLGWVVVGYSEKAFSAPVPAPAGNLFVDGVGKGVLPYEIVKSGYDKLKPASAGTSFDFNVCSSAASVGKSCTLQTPNLN